MGREVLELLNDRAERLEREAENRGLARGMKQGMRQGMRKGAADLAELLMELGVSEDLVGKAMETLQEKREREASVEEE